MKYSLVYLIVILFLLTIVPLYVIALDQSLSIRYSFTNDSVFRDSVEFSEVYLRVITEIDSNCKYSNVPDKSYENLEGQFDISSGLVHEKTFSDLSEGLHKIYVQCRSIPDNGNHTELEILLRVNPRVFGKITLSKDNPLGSGTVDVNLQTSRVVSGIPELKYSFDNLVYNNLPLAGSGNQWKGYLIIPSDIGEAVLSFKFKAIDLEGRIGEIIESGNVFVIDSIRPILISNIRIIGYTDRIELDWYYSDEYSKFNIYRSLNPHPDYTQFYKSVTTTNFIDTLVEQGKTYYYRVTAIDEAGNEGDLSVEVSSTVLRSEIGQVNSSIGLALEFHGIVDNFLNEIDDLINEVNVVQESLGKKSSTDDFVIIELGLSKEILSVKNELESLKRDVEKYKLQDLSKEELIRKLDSSRLKLGIIEKKIPEDIIILDELDEGVTIDENLITETLFLLNPSMENGDVNKNLKSTLKIIKDSGLKINSKLYSLEISYLDGSSKKISLVVRDISAELENIENVYFVEYFPSDLVDLNEVIVKNPDYDVLKENPVFSFSSDTKHISMVINKELSIKKLQEIVPSIVSNDPNQDGGGENVTGFFLFGLDQFNSPGIVLGVIFAVSLVAYLVYLKNNRLSLEALKFLESVDKALDSVLSNQLSESKKSYNGLKSQYPLLDKKDKSLIYPKLDELRNKILILEIEVDISEFDKTEDRGLFKKIEKNYDLLSDKYRDEIAPIFLRIKSRVDGLR